MGETLQKMGTIMSSQPNRDWVLTFLFKKGKKKAESVLLSRIKDGGQIEFKNFDAAELAQIEKDIQAKQPVRPETITEEEKGLTLKRYPTYKMPIFEQVPASA